MDPQVALQRANGRIAELHEQAERSRSGRHLTDPRQTQRARRGRLVARSSCVRARLRRVRDVLADNT